MALTVLYFAAARERAGTAQETVEWAGGPVRQLLETLAARHPDLRALLPHLRVAVDQEFTSLDAAVPDGAEVALVPPVAGGSDCFRLSDAPLELEEVVRAVGGPERGGVVTFTGTVRSETRGRRVRSLSYEAYAGMAERSMASIGREIESRWPGSRVAIVHRKGTLAPGEAAVVIAVSAPHRAAAFEGCRHAIERLKADVPIWKKERFEDGEEWVGLGP
ncbi:MAG TPA: molybdenum cofactor biosynthesis protein MoaE [Myxococcaceae bacterium]|nr:molybdenum cofactor biosynthesis protein MoaE [Myxococcaceae bacterium]